MLFMLYLLVPGWFIFFLYACAECHGHLFTQVGSDLYVCLSHSHCSYLFQSVTSASFFFTYLRLLTYSVCTVFPNTPLSHSFHAPWPLNCILLLMSIYLSHFAPAHPPLSLCPFLTPISFCQFSMSIKAVSFYKTAFLILLISVYSSHFTPVPFSPTYSAPVQLSVLFSPGPFTVHYIRLSHTVHG